ncbi:unnamed protein product, partial [Pylaiella littoralis]
ATLLGTPPSTDDVSNSFAAAMLEQATNDPSHIRDWLEQQVPEAAGECECEVPLPKWDKKNPNRTTTCGNQQGFLVSQLDIQGVLDRQKEREGNGDNVSYVLARTIRSNLQYEAAKLIGCTGMGNQCKRGHCFARAMQMF